MFPITVWSWFLHFQSLLQVIATMLQTRFSKMLVFSQLIPICTSTQITPMASSGLSSRYLILLSFSKQGDSSTSRPYLLLTVIMSSPSTEPKRDTLIHLWGWFTLMGLNGQREAFIKGKQRKRGMTKGERDCWNWQEKARKRESSTCRISMGLFERVNTSPDTENRIW